MAKQRELRSFWLVCLLVACVGGLEWHLNFGSPIFDISADLNSDLEPDFVIRYGDLNVTNGTLLVANFETGIDTNPRRPWDKDFRMCVQFRDENDGVSPTLGTSIHVNWKFEDGTLFSTIIVLRADQGDVTQQALLLTDGCVSPKSQQAIIRIQPTDWVTVCANFDTVENSTTLSYPNGSAIIKIAGFDRCLETSYTRTTTITGNSFPQGYFRNFWVSENMTATIPDYFLVAQEPGLPPNSNAPTLITTSPTQVPTVATTAPTVATTAPTVGTEAPTEETCTYTTTIPLSVCENGSWVVPGDVTIDGAVVLPDQVTLKGNLTLTKNSVISLDHVQQNGKTSLKINGCVDFKDNLLIISTTTPVFVLEIETAEICSEQIPRVIVRSSGKECTVKPESILGLLRVAWTKDSCQSSGTFKKYLALAPLILLFALLV